MFEPLVDEVELIEANPRYAHIRFPDGREDTVSLKHLAPQGDAKPECQYELETQDAKPECQYELETQDVAKEIASNEQHLPPEKEGTQNQIQLRRSERVRRAPDRLGY